MIWPGATEPTGWKFCNAQELDISIYAALFAILGYTYNPTMKKTVIHRTLESYKKHTRTRTVSLMVKNTPYT